MVLKYGSFNFISGCCLLLLLELLDELREFAAGVAHQCRGRVELFDLAEAEDEDLVAFDDGVDAMRDDDHGRVFEFGGDQLLYFLLGNDVNVGGRLVQDDQL